MQAYGDKNVQELLSNVEGPGFGTRATYEARQILDGTFLVT
jgi:hypothetical protein